MGYNQKLLMDFSLSMAILILVTAIAMLIYPQYLVVAKLVNPLQYARDVRTPLMIELAHLGLAQKINTSDVLSLVSDLPENISHIAISPQGHVSMRLADDSPSLNQKTLAINAALNQQQGYAFISYLCGDFTAPQYYQVNQMIDSDIDSHYTQLICRN